MLNKYILLCLTTIAGHSLAHDERLPLQQNNVHNTSHATNTQRPQRKLASILQRLKTNNQKTLNDLLDHMQHNSEHSHNNHLMHSKKSDGWEAVECFVRYAASHKDVDWLRSKQDRDQRVINSLEALLFDLEESRTQQDLSNIIDELHIDQGKTIATRDNHSFINNTLFYGLYGGIGAIIFCAVPHKRDRLISAVGGSAVFGSLLYYCLKYKDLSWLTNDIEERRFTIQDLKKLVAMLPKTNPQV